MFNNKLPNAVSNQHRKSEANIQYISNIFKFLLLIFVKYGGNILFNKLYARVRNFFVRYFVLSHSIIRDYKLNYLTNKRL